MCINVVSLCTYMPGEFHEQRSLEGYCPQGSQRVGHNRATNARLLVKFNFFIFVLIASVSSHMNCSFMSFTSVKHAFLLYTHVCRASSLSTTLFSDLGTQWWVRPGGSLPTTTLSYLSSCRQIFLLSFFEFNFPCHMS